VGGERLGGRPGSSRPPSRPAAPACRLACGQGSGQRVGGGQAGAPLRRPERNPHLRRASVSVSRRGKRCGTNSFLRRRRRAAGQQGRGRAPGRGGQPPCRGCTAARAGGSEPESAPRIPARFPTSLSSTVRQSRACAFTAPAERGAGRAIAQRGNGNPNPAVQHTDVAGGIQTRDGCGPEASALLGAGREAATARAARVFISRLDTLPGFNPLVRLSSLNQFPCKFSRRNSSCFSLSAMTMLFHAQPWAQPLSRSSPRRLPYRPTGNPRIQKILSFALIQSFFFFFFIPCELKFPGNVGFGKLTSPTHAQPWGRSVAWAMETPAGAARPLSPPATPEPRDGEAERRTRRFSPADTINPFCQHNATARSGLKVGFVVALRML